MAGRRDPGQVEGRGARVLAGAGPSATTPAPSPPRACPCRRGRTAAAAAAASSRARAARRTRSASGWPGTAITGAPRGRRSRRAPAACTSSGVPVAVHQAHPARESAGPARGSRRRRGPGSRRPPPRCGPGSAQRRRRRQRDRHVDDQRQVGDAPVDGQPVDLAAPSPRPGRARRPGTRATSRGSGRSPPSAPPPAPARSRAAPARPGRRRTGGPPRPGSSSPGAPCQQDLAHPLAQRRAARLARAHHLQAAGLEGVGEHRGLGALAAAVHALERDEAPRYQGWAPNAAATTAADDRQRTPASPPRGCRAGVSGPSARPPPPPPGARTPLDVPSGPAPPWS